MNLFVMEAAKRQNIFIIWFVWQFYEMPKFLLVVWKNYLLFAANYFSLPLLLKTFLAPWRRYNWKYPKGFNIVEFFNTFISNVFSRLLGAMMRIALIVIGLLLQIFVIAAGLAVFAGWLAIPFAIAAGFLFVFM